MGVVMELEYKKVESIEVKGVLFSCASKWNGLEEWQDAEGRKMIVVRGYEGPCAEAFKNVFQDVSLGGWEPGKLRVISASPDLVELLKA